MILILKNYPYQYSNHLNRIVYTPFSMTSFLLGKDINVFLIFRSALHIVIKTFSVGNSVFNFVCSVSCTAPASTLECISVDSKK